MHFTITIYNTIISKIRQKSKKKCPIVKKRSRNSCILQKSSAQFQNDQMKTAEDAFYNYYI